MTPATLARVGSALYGPSWQTPLAEALRVNSRTVRRWKAGDAPIPAAVEAELLAMLRWRRAELGRLADALAPGEDVAGLVERLREHCVGHPAAKVPWPHSVLHDAMHTLTTLSARVREAEAALERDRSTVADAVSAIKAAMRRMMR